MKRLVALLLAVTMVTTLLAGCGKKDADTSSDNGKITWPTASGDSVFVSADDSNSNQNGNNANQNTNTNANTNTNTNTNTNSNSQNNSSTNNGIGNLTVNSSTSNNKPNNSSDNNTQSGNSNNNNSYKDISGSGLTQNGVETILSTTPITDEFYQPGFQKLKYTHTNNKQMTYSLRLPTNYDENKKYPVLMFLHGINNTGTDGNTLVHLPPLYQHNADIVNNAIFISPQATDKDLWASNGNGAMAYGLLEKIEKEYSVDKNRIYIMGLSMGGIGTWYIIQDHPDHFAAASPICGMGDPTRAKDLVNIPIWAWHGTADTTVDYKWGGATPFMYDAITKAGGKLMTFSKLEGVGHDAWTPAFSSRAHLSWMFSQIKGKHQSKNYSIIPYLTIVDSNGKVVISEKDADTVRTREGTGQDTTKRDLMLYLTKDGKKKLSAAYEKSGGKPFTVYFGNKQILTFKATKKTEGQVLVIRDVFTETGYTKYTQKLNNTVGKN
jgi:predicted peptidase